MKKEDLSKALEDLDSAFENLEVKPLSDSDLGRVAGGSYDLNGTCGATCNSKCGPTGYWECSTDACSWTCNYTQQYVNGVCV